MNSEGNRGGRTTIRIRGMSREALIWVRGQAVAEGKTIGNLVSELIYEYWNDVSQSKKMLPRAPYTDYSHKWVDIRRADRTVWRWLRGEAKLQRKTSARILCELIARYQGRVEAMGFANPQSPSPGLAGPVESKMSSHIPHRADPGVTYRIFGTHPALWSLVKARVRLENKTLGELVNEVIGAYRESVGESGSRLEMTSPYGLVPGARRSVRSIDSTLWRWIRTHCILEGYELHRVLNELLYRRVSAASAVKPVVRTRYLECVMCGRLFEAKRSDSKACSSRCTVALYRARRSGRYTG